MWTVTDHCVELMGFTPKNSGRKDLLVSLHVPRAAAPSAASTRALLSVTLCSLLRPHSSPDLLSSPLPSVSVGHLILPSDSGRPLGTRVQQAGPCLQGLELGGKTVSERARMGLRSSARQGSPFPRARRSKGGG